VRKKVALKRKKLRKPLETQDTKVHDGDTFRASKETESEQESSVKEEKTSERGKQLETEDNGVHDENTFQASEESESEQESFGKEEETSDTPKNRKLEII
jgi:hypothetical protein